jgi:DNA polymerase-3 subunit gamma/tau
LIALCEDKGELLMASQLINHAHPVSFETGRFEFRPDPEAPANLAQKLAKSLQDWTGSRWMISVSSAEGQPTLAQRRNSAKAALRAEVLDHPDVKAVLDIFTGAELHRIIEDQK